MTHGRPWHTRPVDARLILTVTRACNCRCSYCPTVKEGFPSLGPAAGVAAVRLLASHYAGNELQITGGEPLLEPATVRAVLAEAEALPAIRRVLLCTNGLALTPSWLAELARYRKTAIVLSLDGRPADHRRHRRALTAGGDGDGFPGDLLPQLSRTPRLVVTQTIAPDLAAFAAANFDYLLSCGFRRFKFLPVYYRPWQSEQIAALREALATIADAIRERWAAGERLYVRNLFTWSPTPLFHVGVVVDADGSLLASNAGLSTECPELLAQTRVGSLDDPPSAEAIAETARRVPALVERAVPAELWQSTLAVDRELSRLCRMLYPAYLALRERRRGRP